MKGKGKLNIYSSVWRAVGVLFICVLLTSHFSSNYAAKFLSQDFGADGATVAKFDVTASCIYNEDTQTYQITVTNHSEVTVSYALANSSLPSGVTIADGSGILAPGETSSHTISFEESYTQIHGDINVDILRIEQVD